MANENSPLKKITIAFERLYNRLTFKARIRGCGIETFGLEVTHQSFSANNLNLETQPLCIMQWIPPETERLRNQILFEHRAVSMSNYADELSIELIKACPDVPCIAKLRRISTNDFPFGFRLELLDDQTKDISRMPFLVIETNGSISGRDWCDFVSADASSVDVHENYFSFRSKQVVENLNACAAFHLNAALLAKLEQNNVWRREGRDLIGENGNELKFRIVN